MKWPDYVKTLIGSDTQMTVKEKTGVDQTTVSRWLRGKTSPQDPAVVAHFAQCYNGNVLEAFVAAGFLTREEAGMPPAPRLSFVDLIDEDPDLSPEAKVHIKNQYGLLKAASANSRAILLREQIERSQTLDPETRAQLLATLDGGSPERVEQTAEELSETLGRRWGRRASDRLDRELSDRSDTTFHAVAAHEEEVPIAGETGDEEHP